MPGPMTLPTPSLPFGDWWRQLNHPIFNAQGRQVGSYVTLDAACRGDWLLFAGETQPPPGGLYVHGPLFSKVPLSSRCVAAAKATAHGSVLSTKVTPASAAKAVADTNRSVTGSAAPINPDTIIPQGGVSVGGITLSADQTRLALYGLAAAAGLVLLMDGGGRRRRR